MDEKSKKRPRGLAQKGHFLENSSHDFFQNFMDFRLKLDLKFDIYHISGITRFFEL